MDTGKVINGHYEGQRGPLFNLAFKTAMLTAVTLGIYRFWAKTRIRNYIWSSMSGDGDSFEYTGTGLEKFLGFLVAIMILAVYLCIVQMVLFYFGLTLFREPTTTSGLLAQLAALYITILAVVPLIFFAQYRARRYKLARTRWRGLRFGAEKGAWGYVLRAIGHWLLTIVTLGLLLPRQTFWLEKYVTDRSWYGDAKFEQSGSWTGLYPAMKHLFIGAAVMFAGVALGAASDSPVLTALFGVVGYIWLMIGLVIYRVRSFVYLTNNKILDGKITFRAITETGEIVLAVLGGGLVVGILTGIVFVVVGFVASAVVGPLVAGGGAGVVFGLIMLAGAYIAAFVVAGALTLVWITQPVIERVVRSVKINNFEEMDSIRQRVADKGADAEGFADALDVGGAI